MSCQVTAVPHASNNWVVGSLSVLCIFCTLPSLPVGCFWPTRALTFPATSLEHHHSCHLPWQLCWPNNVLLGSQKVQTNQIWLSFQLLCKLYVHTSKQSFMSIHTLPFWVDLGHILRCQSSFQCLAAHTWFLLLRQGGAMKKWIFHQIN